MLPKRKFVVWTFGLSIFLLFLVLLATNPSEQKMIDALVEERLALVSAHVEQCEHCTDVPTRKEMTELTKLVFRTSGIQYQSYYLFSALKLESTKVSQANLIGALGTLFVRSLPSYACPNDFKVEMPDIDFALEPDPATTIEVEIDVNGVCRMANEVVSLEELEVRVRKLIDDGFEGVIIRANKKTKYRDLDKVKRSVSKAGIKRIHVGVSEK